MPFHVEHREDSTADSGHGMVSINVQCPVFSSSDGADSVTPSVGDRMAAHQSGSSSAQLIGENQVARVESNT